MDIIIIYGKTFRRPKEIFFYYTKEQLEKDWEEIKHLNEIDDGGMLDFMLKEYEQNKENTSQMLHNERS